MDEQVEMLVEESEIGKLEEDLEGIDKRAARSGPFSPFSPFKGLHRAFEGAEGSRARSLFILYKSLQEVHALDIFDPDYPRICQVPAISITFNQQERNRRNSL
ncbi:Hypothetical predicted protein [Pelobates cultripes]|uniref:Uncharacterized protein n=1 Tax=Pelobates cultripes TaxID=61616 RepID=A0AAD1S296_PELCU|nr:Hypothetical predicted protein [Pelobates cultripes]